MTITKDIQKSIDEYLCESNELPWRRIGRVLGVGDGGRMEQYMPEPLIEESQKITAIINRAKPIAESLRALLKELDDATAYDDGLSGVAMGLVDEIMEEAYAEPAPLTEGGWVDAGKMKVGK